MEWFILIHRRLPAVSVSNVQTSTGTETYPVDAIPRSTTADKAAGSNECDECGITRALNWIFADKSITNCANCKITTNSKRPTSTDGCESQKSSPNSILHNNSFTSKGRGTGEL